ncbi:prolipoprotein diacylglyceryl transferase [Candidatus Peregrinibacteria bacterium]|nr:prolipoprotein diacylglyceryl transferase [Candidatus Peregrinibacteria bacterium]
MFSAGPLEVRWYGLMFAFGLLLTYWYIWSLYRREKLQTSDFDSLAIYLFIGMLLGARFGHVFFYEASYYLAHPLEILQVWKGGLASHGGAIGVTLAYYLWLRVHKKKFSMYSDLLAMGFPIVSGFVRLGNFFNSEINGFATDGSYGVIFKQLGEDFPRHPVQLYAVLMNWSVFLILFIIYRKWYKHLPKLFITFLYILLYFAGRFIVEYWKDLHWFSADFPLSMGQVLSIGPILIAIFGLYWVLKKNRRKTT